MHEALNIDKNKKLIVQFVYKSWDKSFKLSYSMIGQYLSNKNKNATISKFKNFLDLNKAWALLDTETSWELRVACHRGFSIHGDQATRY